MPVGVAVVLGCLLTPRRVSPGSVPLPVADAHAVARAARADQELANQARSAPLSDRVRALGSAIRDFHSLEGGDADARTLGDTRRTVDAALVDVLRDATDGLLRLRAVQLEGFLVEVRRFEVTGEQSVELHALAGAFVRTMTSEGWCVGHTLAPTEPVLRVMFKEMWNAFLGLSGHKELTPALDEQRSLYAFYLSHAHPSKAMREALAAARRGAPDAKACEGVVEAERAAVESWRIERIDRLAVIDPGYPADYARGVASFRRGDFAASSRDFRAWLNDHPEGPLALRAQNYLRAAIDANQVE